MVEETEELTDALVRDLGMLIDADEPRSVKAGLLGEVILQPPSTTAGSRVLEAIAHAQMRTGAPILGVVPPIAAAAVVPTGADADVAAVASIQAVDILVSNGALAERIVVSGAQHLLPSPSKLRALLGKGVSLCFEGIGNSW